MKINKATIPTEWDLNKHEFMAIFLRWHFNKNKLHRQSIVHTQKLVYVFYSQIFRIFSNRPYITFP